MTLFFPPTCIEKYIQKLFTLLTIIDLLFLLFCVIFTNHQLRILLQLKILMISTNWACLYHTVMAYVKSPKFKVCLSSVPTWTAITYLWKEEKWPGWLQTSKHGLNLMQSFGKPQIFHIDTLLIKYLIWYPLGRNENMGVRREIVKWDSHK